MLIRELGIEGRSGVSGGERALELAARNNHVEMLRFLTIEGAVDAGVALNAAAQAGREPCVKFLLQRREEKNLCEGFYAALGCGASAWYGSIRAADFSTSRIVRMLVDAGMDTSLDSRYRNPRDEVLFYGTPLAFTNMLLREKTVMGKTASEAQLHHLEATRRVLLQEEAVHAVSWLWPSDAPSVNDAAIERATGIATTSAPLMPMLSLRRRTRRRGVLRGGALSRWVLVCCEAGAVIQLEAPSRLPVILCVMYWGFNETCSWSPLRACFGSAPSVWFVRWASLCRFERLNAEVSPDFAAPFCARRCCGVKPRNNLGNMGEG